MMVDLVSRSITGEKGDAYRIGQVEESRRIVLSIVRGLMGAGRGHGVGSSAHSN
jgi:hypothetical protein